MRASSIDAPVRVGLLALPETTPTVIYGLQELFAAVGVAWRDITGEETKARRIEPLILARSAEPFTLPPGVPLAPHATLDAAGDLDAVIVTDLALNRESRTRGRWPQETAWVRERFAQGALVASVCTGSVFLAEAGLLDGVETASHWGVTRLFAEFYPRVTLRPEHILCADGPEHRIVTGGGSGSWTDLGLYLIARFSGREEAVRIAKVFVLGDRTEGQLPFSAMGKPPAHTDKAIARCQKWLADHYNEANPVARMAALSGLSERTFKRRFKMATGYTPIDYVQSLRIEEAKHLLERSDEGTDMIAHLVGYDDPAFFRRLFKRMTNVSPARYRQRYRLIGMAVETETAGVASSAGLTARATVRAGAI